MKCSEPPDLCDCFLKEGRLTCLIVLTFYFLADSILQDSFVKAAKGMYSDRQPFR